MGKGFVFLIACLGLTACVGPDTLEHRNGYSVDHRYVATSQSSRVRHLVMHYTDGDQAHSLAALTGPHVSSHYLVPRSPSWVHGEPRIYQLVDESRRAWHAGISQWRDRNNINDTSIGIEIVNKGPLNGPKGGIWAPFPRPQIDALIALAQDIVSRYGIDATGVVGHADIAPSRKIDPGPRFPWQRLHAAGIGAWPDAADVRHYLTRFQHTPPSLPQLQLALCAYGYPIKVSGALDAQTHDVLRAFQMHFRPANYAGSPDPQTAAILWALLERYRPEALAQLDDSSNGAMFRRRCPPLDRDSESHHGNVP